jgi:hypothetical protein
MKIGIDARLMHYQRAGIGQYTQRLVQALAAIDHDNSYVIFQSRKDLVPLAEGRHHTTTMSSGCFPSSCGGFSLTFSTVQTLSLRSVAAARLSSPFTT